MQQEVLDQFLIAFDGCLCRMCSEAIIVQPALSEPHTIQMKKSAQREANTARALAVIRCGHCPPAVTNPQTGPTTIHCAAAS